MQAGDTAGRGQKDDAPAFLLGAESDPAGLDLTPKIYTIDLRLDRTALVGN